MPIHILIRSAAMGFDEVYNVLLTTDHQLLITNFMKICYSTTRISDVNSIAFLYTALTPQYLSSERSIAF